jgi:epoxyqueuosine reductase
MAERFSGNRDDSSGTHGPLLSRVMTLTQRLHDLARTSGAAGTGVCTAAPFLDAAESLAERVADGSSAGMAFTFRSPEISTDVTRSFPWATRLFVVATAYLPAAGSPRREAGLGRIARFANRDHYEELEAILEGVAGELRAAGHRAVTLHDDNRLVDRAAAVRAGVGWWGKNTMVLMPGAGPWVLLGSVVTDADLDPSQPMRRNCGACVACLPACPTGALIAPGVLDARRCLAYLLQAPGEIPRSVRPLVGDRVYGCDDCLEACPPGLRLLETAVRPFGTVNLLEMLAMDDDSLLAAHRHFYVPDRRARYLRRNALVALGNSRAAGSALNVLAGYVGHPDWLLRLHAAWALGRGGGPRSRAVLVAALEDEPDERVRAEIDEALSDVGAATGADEPGLR